ncbi:MAG: hypothetical protein ACLUSS_01595, partial [Faecalibacterium sp.]
RSSASRSLLFPVLTHFYRNFQKQCLSKRHICDMQFADAACAFKTQTAIHYFLLKHTFGRNATEKTQKAPGF